MNKKILVIFAALSLFVIMAGSGRKTNVRIHPWVNIYVWSKTNNVTIVQIISETTPGKLLMTPPELRLGWKGTAQGTATPDYSFMLVRCKIENRDWFPPQRVTGKGDVIKIEIYDNGFKAWSSPWK